MLLAYPLAAVIADKSAVLVQHNEALLYYAFLDVFIAAITDPAGLRNIRPVVMFVNHDRVSFNLAPVSAIETYVVVFIDHNVV